MFLLHFQVKLVKNEFYMDAIKLTKNVKLCGLLAPKAIIPVSSITRHPSVQYLKYIHIKMYIYIVLFLHSN